MKKRYLQILAVGALAAFLVSPLMAGYHRHGPMIIPIYGTEGDEIVYEGPDPVFDDKGNMIGLNVVIGITTTINIPMLGIRNWELPNIADIDLVFGDRDPLILKFTSTGGFQVDGEVISSGQGYGTHRKTSETMSEKHITGSAVFTSGPLEGVYITTTSYTTEPLVGAPPFLGKMVGFMLVPEHVDLRDIRRCAKKSPGKNRRARGGDSDDDD